MLVFDQLDSTNAHLLSRASELEDGTIALAEFQSAGHGRLGRRWESPRGASVLLSVLLKEPAASALPPRATMLAAVAACEAVEQTTACRPAVRWPNDLVVSGRKLGGVLVESTPLSAGSPTGAADRALVLGIGINCLQQRGHFAGELKETATSLEIESPAAIERAAVARRLLERLDAHIAPFTTDANAGTQLLATWKSRCEDFGTRVSLRQDRRTSSGTVLDINEQGDLLVQLDEGGRRYFASATTTRLK